MKNMKVSKKLTVGFLGMTLLIIVMVVGGLYGLFRMGGISNDMYEHKAHPLGDLTTAVEYFQRIRVQTRNAIIYTGNAEQLKTVEADINQREEQFLSSMQAYQPTISTEEGKKLYSEIDEQFNKVFFPGVADVVAGAERGESSTALLESMEATTASANLIADKLSQLVKIRMDVMEAANEESLRVENLIFTVDMIIVIAAICIAIFLTIYISKIISEPITHLYKFMDRAGSTGDIRMTPQDETIINTYANYKDEIGQCIGSVSKFLKHITTISEELQGVSNGDLTVNIVPLSENDVMGVSVKKVVNDLNGIFSEVHHSTVQVSTGSKQVADGSQILAHGSMEQASAVEQLSASVAEITQITKNSAEMAASAAVLATTIKQNAEMGNTQMENMMTAVKEINEASHSISKVIKVIDDIAFQTNILALNAAVEAARAGQHGKGFAVVAEEVRNLAAKSAEAAKDTSSLISNSMEKAEFGAQIANETSASLREIVSGINESSRIITEIAKSSDDQVVGISQLNKSIEQVSEVTQRNSATAEESSAASEEMSGQANLLEALISQFKLTDSNSTAANRHTSLGSNNNGFSISA